MSSAESELRGRLSKLLAAGLEELKLHLSSAQQDLLVEYLMLLNKWNRAYNLTAVRDPEDMVARHLLDSLVALPELRGQRIADVGTGAGLPGVPLAIACPDVHFALIDSNGKKTRFLFEVKSRLGLTNLEIHTLRVENFRPNPLFNMVLSRAYASLEDIVASTEHLLTPTGTLLAWKGQYPAAELAKLDRSWQLAKSFAAEIPRVDAPRHLLAMVRVDAEGAP